MNAPVQTLLPVSKLKSATYTPDLPTPPNSQILIYTDGACDPNPGPGGWAFVVNWIEGGAVIKELVQSGAEPQTTNNRMEMQAAIEALKNILADEAAPITIRSDSELMIKGINERIKGWIAKGWKTSARKPVANRDLWEQILELSQGKTITWSWVKGHAGDPMNEKVDGLAEAAARSVMFTA